MYFADITKHLQQNTGLIQKSSPDSISEMSEQSAILRTGTAGCLFTSLFAMVQEIYQECQKTQ